MMPEHKKWMKRLKKCLSDIPDDCELVIEAETLTTSTIHLLSRGKHNELFEVHQDNMGLPISDNNISSFRAENVMANSETI
tara:strand:+ start:458 stop:700 length:243 start_codon:yes stop_codon:yes gene_type:complete